MTENDMKMPKETRPEGATRSIGMRFTRMEFGQCLMALRGLPLDQVAMLAGSCRSVDWPEVAERRALAAETGGNAESAEQWRSLGRFARRGLLEVTIFAAMESGGTMLVLPPEGDES